MTTEPDYVAIGVFTALFALVTVMGFLAARWKQSSEPTNLDEWGLGGRRFGTWITWFLVGGDFYTAYTIIAVPALVYAVGAYGFFALPYTIIVYPFVFAVMPVLWRVAKAHGHITAADVVYGRFGSRALELAVAITAVIATMPYIALQLVGMAAVFAALGLRGEIPLVIAFVILAVYTYSSGIRAPALIAFVKDILIYVAVIAAVAVIPSKLGGYGAVFDAAAGSQSDAALCLTGAGLGAGSVHVSAHADRDLCQQERQHHPQERNAPACLHLAAGPARLARLHGTRRSSEAGQQQ
jgi:SSS family solute:Na+ symporter